MFSYEMFYVFFIKCFVFYVIMFSMNINSLHIFVSFTNIEIHSARAKKLK